MKELLVLVLWLKFYVNTHLTHVLLILIFITHVVLSVHRNFYTAFQLLSIQFPPFIRQQLHDWRDNMLIK